MSHHPLAQESARPADDVRVRATVTGRQARILEPAALAFYAGLERRFRDRRAALLARRRERQAGFDAGVRPDFLPETRHVRESEWRIAGTPGDLLDRRVEITGPVERKMIVNALNSGARVFMADFEDSNAPTWDSVVDGQLHLADAIRRRIDFEHPETGKRYVLNDETATLVVRPRGWHLDEKHVLVDDRPGSGSLFDFALYLFHNARALLAAGTGPYFYLPKLESHLEARLWNDVFVAASDALGLPLGTIKATVLIETLPAVFEMDEILWELRDHAVGLNCGRWDYVFSYIKTFRAHRDFVLPDRGSVGMDRPFLAAYSRLLIETCHRRGAHAMGGMAAQIPIQGDPARHEAALAKVRADKRREADGGHDGTWVAHPGLVPVALAEFDRVLSERPNQIDRAPEGSAVTAADLIEPPRGEITWGGLRQNLSVGLRYLAAWLSGRGCVPLDHLMEDAATAEISRAQVWQWRRHGARLEDGRPVTDGLIRAELESIERGLRRAHGDVAHAAGRYELAARLLGELLVADELPEFLTLTAYAYL